MTCCNFTCRFIPELLGGFAIAIHNVTDELHDEHTTQKVLIFWHSGHAPYFDYGIKKLIGLKCLNIKSGSLLRYE